MTHHHHRKSHDRGCLLWLGPLVLLSSLSLRAAGAPEKQVVPTDDGWPREFSGEQARITCYQPQVDEWENYRILHARLAVSFAPVGESPALGVAEVTGETTTDRETRTVVIRNIRVAAARFPSVAEEDETRLAAELKKNFPKAPLTVSLDRLLAGVKLAKGAARPVEVKMDPPPIFVSTAPAMILLVEGKPVLSPAEKTGLKFVVNTNWDLFFDEAAGTYSLLSGDEWLSAANLEGPWALAESVPAALAKLPDDPTWKHVRSELPWKVKKGMIVPRVFYADKPSELIIFQGDPVWNRLEDSPLAWASNTDSPVFQDTTTGTVYYLVSGRWFRTPKLGEPWVYAGNDLPEAFKRIPGDSPCGEVLASVPGTEEAEDAVVMASVPVEAVIKIKEAEARAKAVYHGDPSFKTIEGTALAYADNSGSDVIQCDGKYYLCQDAVWFLSASATGPWKVCKDVPDGIYAIPASAPVYHVTYVHVEEDDDDDEDRVTCSYTAGYFGAFVAGLALGECLVWGTGYYYPPYIGWGPYPAYYPYPVSYGVAAAYNPWTGGYAIGERVYGPYATAGRAAWYNPATGRYGRAARIEGPYGARTAAAGYNPRTGGSYVTRQGNNGYAQWGASAASRGDHWVQSAHVVTPDGGAAAWRGSNGAGRLHWSDEGSGGMAVHNGDFYAGHDGNVYRKEDGQWSKWQDGGWQSTGHKADGIRPPHPGVEPRPGPGPEPRPGPEPDKSRNGVITGQTRHTPEARPGARGAGERTAGDRPEGLPSRPGANGGGERQPAAPVRPPDDSEVFHRLNREAASRDRGEERTQRFQPQRSGFDGRGIQRGGGFQRGGGGGFRGGGGGFRRR